MAQSINGIRPLFSNLLSQVIPNNFRSELLTTESLAITNIEQPIEGDVDGDRDIGRDAAKASAPEEVHDQNNDLNLELPTTESLAITNIVQPIEGDVDDDGDIDTDDFALIRSAIRDPASGPNDPRDLDGDGRISVLDARKWVLLSQAETEFGVAVDPVMLDEGNEGMQTVTFTVTRVGSVLGASVDYSILGTATLDQDYENIRGTSGATGLTGTIHFAPGETEKTIELDVLGDNVYEPNETISVELSNASSPNGNATMSNVITTLTIRDEDPLPTVSILTPNRFNEGDGDTKSYDFTVKLSNPSSEAIKIALSTQNGTATDADNDFVGIPEGMGMITFEPGKDEKEISIQINDDQKLEQEEDFMVSLDGVVTNNAVIDPDAAMARGVILDNELLPIVSLSPPVDLVIEGDAGTQDHILFVELSKPSEEAITVNYDNIEYFLSATVADNDYEDIINGQVTFAPGETRQEISVIINGDTLDENNEVFDVALTGVATNNARINPFMTRRIQQVIILNDDALPILPVSIGFGEPMVSGLEGDAGPGMFLDFPVVLSNPATVPIEVQYMTVDIGSAESSFDYVGTSGRLRFNPLDVTETIRVRVNPDTQVEGDEQFRVVLLDSSPDLSFIGIDPLTSVSTGIILDDDDVASDPTVSITTFQALSEEEDTGTRIYTFEVALSRSSDQIITVDYTTNDGSATVADHDYIDNDGTLIFLPGETQQNITVEVRGDTQSEIDESFTVSLNSATNAIIDPNASERDGIILTDDPRPSKGVSWGDPHLITFDGLNYEFQTVGEFTLVESNSEDWEIQVRQESFGDSDRVSANTAVATLVDGENVGFYLGQAQPLEINGIATALDDDGFLTVGNSLITRDDTTYTVIYAGDDGIVTSEDDRLVTTLFPDHMLVEVFLSDERMEAVQGLLGNGDLDTTNDFALRDGTVLDQPVPFPAIYGGYADSWRIGDGASLFRDTISFDPNFPNGPIPLTVRDLRLEDLAKVAQAEQMLRDANIPSVGEFAEEFDAAVIDLFVSDGDPSFIEAVSEAIEPFGELTVTWTGEGDGINYSDPNNWNINTVPLNTDDTRFSVIIPSGFPNPTYDVSGDTFKIDNFTLDNDSAFNLSSNTSLKVVEKADIAGIINAEGGDFFAPTEAEFVGDRVRLSASDGSTVAIAAPSYSSAGLNVTETILSADGENTQLDLSSLTSLDTSFNDGSGGTSTHTITATNGGMINLSGLETLTAPVRGEDHIDFIVSGEMSEIDLSSLQTIDGTGQARFDVAEGMLLLGNVTNITTLVGEGNINANTLTNDSLLNPGIETGTLNLNGNYTQTINGTLNIELGGTMADEFDQLLISNIADLSGTLDVSLVNGYIPTVGDSFDILTFGTSVGDFTNVNLPTLSGGLSLNAQFNGNNLTLEVV